MIDSVLCRLERFGHLADYLPSLRKLCQVGALSDFIGAGFCHIDGPGSGPMALPLPAKDVVPRADQPTLLQPTQLASGLTAVATSCRRFRTPNPTVLLLNIQNWHRELDRRSDNHSRLSILKCETPDPPRSLNSGGHPGRKASNLEGNCEFWLDRAVSHHHLSLPGRSRLAGGARPSLPAVTDLCGWPFPNQGLVGSGLSADSAHAQPPDSLFWRLLSHQGTLQPARSQVAP